MSPLFAFTRRHFNAHRLPSVKYHNQHIEFSVEKPRDSYAEGKAPCGIEVVFGKLCFVYVLMLSDYIASSFIR